MKKVLVTIMLLLLIAGAGVGAFYFQGQTRQLHADGQALVTAAEDALASARADLNAIDPSTVEGEELRLASEQAIVDEALDKAKALEEENTTLDDSILQTQSELDSILEQEDNAYYMSVYESYSRGMKIVEDSIEGS